MLTCGEYGGFYVHRHRISLGWVAVTWLSVDIDEILLEYRSATEK